MQPATNDERLLAEYLHHQDLRVASESYPDSNVNHQQRGSSTSSTNASMYSNRASLNMHAVEYQNNPPARHPEPEPVVPRNRSTSGSSGSNSTNKRAKGVVGAADGWSEHSGESDKPNQGAKAAKGEKVKRTRNRKPSSCVQCRKKKLRCNRAAPCDQCASRGEQCQWDDAVPLFDARAEHDADALRAQVRRLESLVAHLTSQQQTNGDSDNSPPPEANVESPQSPTFDQFPSATRPLLAKIAQHKSDHKMDLRANDLCEALSQLAIKDFVVVEGSGEESWAPGGQRGAPFIDEAASFLATMPQQFGLTYQMPTFGNAGNFASQAFTNSAQAPRRGGSGTSGSDNGATTPSESAELSPSPLGSASFHRSAPPLADALKFLPTDSEAMSAYTYYAGYVSWYAHPVHLPTFEAQWAELKEALKLDDDQRTKRIDPFFVATFLGVCAMGLAMMPAKRAMRDGFGGVEKSKTVDKWLEGAMVALTCGRFLDNPSVESVRAVSVLATYFVFMAHGESSGAGMGLLSLVVQVAMSLNLHRDPDRTPGKFTFFEAETRRRLFYCLFTLCILSSSSLGRTWAVFDLNGVDTKLPLDCHDHEILDEQTALAGVASRRRKFEETPMTSLLLKAKLAVMAKKVNDRAFGIHPVSYATVLELDRDLKEFEDSIPARYQMRMDGVGAIVRPSAHVTVTEMRACMIQISLASEFIRIHRPWLVLAGSNELFQFSRDRCLHYAKLTLAIYRSPSCCQHPWGGLTYKSTSAAVVLAIDILTFPTGSEVDSTRALIKGAAAQMEAREKESSLCRKGARVVRFLLAKEANMLSQREQEKDLQRGGVKRPRHLNTGSAFPAQTLQTVFNPAFVDLPAVPSSAFNADVAEPDITEELPRRLPRNQAPPAPLPHASSTVSYSMPSNSIPASASYDMPPAMERWALPLPRAKKSSQAGSQAGSSRSHGSSSISQSSDYCLDFGATATGLGDFSFDFALPTASLDSAGAIQYQLSDLSQHNPMPPAYMHSHLLTPASTSGPYSPIDVKSQNAPPYAVNATTDSSNLSSYY